jgi:hypothetical protein
MKYLKYLWYVVRHKWCVFLACLNYCDQGNGMVWLGIIHDWSKFRPSEFFPYAEHFYGAGKDISAGRDETGYYKPTDTGYPAFDFAWLLHQKRNKHHWQWWILPEDEGGVKLIPIQPKYRLEMLCDWLGASAAQGHGGDIASVRAWYDKNGHKMQLYPYTREWVEKALGMKGGRA